MPKSKSIRKAKSPPKRVPKLKYPAFDAEYASKKFALSGDEKRLLERFSVEGFPAVRGFKAVRFLVSFARKEKIPVINVLSSYYSHFRIEPEAMKLNPILVAEELARGLEWRKREQEEFKQVLEQRKREAAEKEERLRKSQNFP
ncbi:MAG: hypothetical protein V1847_02990 [Candidatus Diapherotrites archaeon]